MIIGLGLDLVEKDRIAAIYNRYGLKFIRKILTAKELERLPGNPTDYLASRFAAKEAGVKALGTGFSQGITLGHLEILNNSQGKPELYFSGPARERALEMGVDIIHLSLSHGRDAATAVVILEKVGQ
ncbi:MAG: holo-ACP synthase [Desulfonatronovibrio sp. MSAO_Bac4]|nr:MAG: holo-ACP synthase [Desulfonatronovibrio sp. MSAO_Bac4]